MSRPLFTLSIVLGLTAAMPADAKPARNAETWRTANSEKPAVIETLRTIVSLESPTREPGDMAKLGSVLAERLAALGAQVEKIPANTPSKGDMIVGRFKGKGTRRIMMMAHMDTVYPAGILSRRPFRIEVNRAYGPGIADDKGGIAVILHAIALLQRQKFADYGELIVLFNNDEESGSQASKGQIESLAKSSDVVLSFEPTLSAKELIPLKTGGGGNTTVFVTGTAAHSGVEPERGRNALLSAADIMLRTRDLDRPEKGVRFNWTRLETGKIPNQIPESVTIQADTRHVDRSERDKVLAELQARIQTLQIEGTSARMEYREGRPSYVADDESKRWIDRAISIYGQVDGLVGTIPFTTGGTDAAYAQLAGVPVVEGLGLPGFGFHSTDEEYVDLDRIPARLYLAVEMIKAAAR